MSQQCQGHLNDVKDGNGDIWKTPAPSLGKLIQSMLDKRIGTDVIITVKCHSFILAAHLPVLNAMLSDRWTTDNTKIELVDEDIEHMMYWDWNEQTYTGHLKDVPEIEDMTPEVTAGVLSLAHKYGKIIFEYGDESQLSYSDLRNLVKSDDLNSQNDEFSVFNGCYNWALRQCGLRKLDATGNNVRDVLRDILKHIRFTLMDTRTLISAVFPRQILTLEENLEILAFRANRKKRSFNGEPLRFDVEKRTGRKSPNLKRLDYDYVSENLYDFSSTHGFIMRTNCQYKLIGLKFYGGDSTVKNYKFYVELAFQDEEYKFNYTKKLSAKDLAKETISMKFKSEVTIPTDTPVSVKFSIQGGRTYASNEIGVGTEVVVWDGKKVSFTFQQSSEVPSGLQQIPMLMFSLW